MRFYFEEEPITKQEARQILSDKEFERLLQIIESCDGECIDIHSGRLDYEGLRNTTVEIDGKGVYSETGEVDETAKVLDKTMTNKEYQIDSIVRTRFIYAIEDVINEICKKCKSGYCWDCGLTGTEFSENLADTVISSLDSERCRMEGVKNA